MIRFFSLHCVPFCLICLFSLFFFFFLTVSSLNVSHTLLLLESAFNSSLHWTGSRAHSDQICDNISVLFYHCAALSSCWFKACRYLPCCPGLCELCATMGCRSCDDNSFTFASPPPSGANNSGSVRSHARYLIRAHRGGGAPKNGPQGAGLPGVVTG